jgi:CubicO group peptidase (beta-lactamase class C family)
MQRTRTLIASTIFSFILLGCNNEPAQAYPPKKIDNSKRALSTALSYDTTSTESRELIRRLDSFYRIQVAHGFNGSVLIGKDGNVLYERYYGYANREGLQKLQPNSSSQLASTSKTFTSAAILYMYENKMLDINEPVNAYLKGFPYPGVTIKMLLDHRSGLPDYLKFTPKYKKLKHLSPVMT